MMTLDQLRVFITVAEREHLTRAAAALNLTPFQQSARLSELALIELGGLPATAWSSSARPITPWHASGRCRPATWRPRAGSCETGSGTRSVFEAALRARGIDPATLRTVLELPTNEAACVAVRVSTHLTVVSDLVARPHVEAGRLVPVAFDLGTRTFGLVRHRQRYRTKASKAFEALMPARDCRSTENRSTASGINTILPLKTLQCDRMCLRPLHCSIRRLFQPPRKRAC